MKLSHVLVALLLVACFASQGRAAVVISETSQPTPGLAGFTTFTINVVSDTVDIGVFDLAFTGPINHVNPFGLPTVFLNNNSFFSFAGEEVLQDSQFLFDQGQINVLSSGESPTTLSAQFFGTTFGMDVDVARIVLPDSDTANLNYMIGDGNGQTLGSGSYTVNAPPAVIPAPAAGLAGLALGAAGMMRRRRAVDG